MQGNPKNMVYFGCQLLFTDLQRVETNLTEKLESTNVD